MLKTFFFLLFPLFLFSHEPVDIVYTWVDGRDPLWQEIRTKEIEKEFGIQPRGSDATAAKRFRSRDELKYSLRSIHQFAPWVRHIYIVTFNQKPSWLKEHPKITIVDHKEIFLDKSHLPTFNSMAIECHLHRIPDLQEHYIYFNDDFFLGRVVTFSDFFTEDGKMRAFPSRAKIKKGLPNLEDNGFDAACKNTNQLLNELIGKKRRNKPSHTPHAFKKSVVSRIEKQFSEIFTAVSSHKFRSLNDYTITNGLIPYIAMHDGDAEKAFPDHKTVHFGKDIAYDKKKIQQLLDQRPQFFCIEDSSEEESAESFDLLSSFFISYFPTPAPWEEMGGQLLLPKGRSL